MQTFGVFVKHPVAGRVKTRLATVLGDDAALQLYTAFLHDLVCRFADLDARRVLGFTSDNHDSRTYFQHLASGDYDLWPQPSSDLGRRMFAFFSDHLQKPGDRAVLIGSDSPSLPTRYVLNAMELLMDTDVVLGPAADGGYYLVAMRFPANDIFQHVAWSEPSVLGRTAERIAALGLRLRLLPVWYDVDTSADLEMLRGHLAALRLSGDGHDCPATWDALAQIPKISTLETCPASAGNP